MVLMAERNELWMILNWLNDGEKVGQRSIEIDAQSYLLTLLH